MILLMTLAHSKYINTLFNFMRLPLNIKSFIYINSNKYYYEKHKLHLSSTSPALRNKNDIHDMVIFSISVFLPLPISRYLE